MGVRKDESRVKEISRKGVQGRQREDSRGRHELGRPGRDGGFHDLYTLT